MYIKMDSPEALLLLEEVCRELGMVTYHSHVVVKKADFDALQGDLKDFLKTSSESVVAHLHLQV